MSLINDALNRARAEATRQEAEEHGEPPMRAAGTDRSFRLPPAIWAAGVVILVALLGGLWLRQGPPPTELAAAAPPGTRTPSQEISAALAEESTADTGEGRSERTSSREVQRTAPSSREAAASVSSGVEPATPAPPVDRSAPIAQPPTAASQASPPYPEERTPAQPLAQAVVERPPPAASPDAEQSRSTGAAPAEPTSTTSAATSPAAVWPADGDNVETWYYVGQFTVPGGGAIELGGIVWSESAPSVLLNGSLLGIGDEILGLTVGEIGPRTVVLEGRGQRIALQLGAAKP